MQKSPVNTSSAAKNEDILNIIIDFIQEHGYPPTVEEIGDIAGFKSKNSTWNHLKQMFSAGMLETDHPGCARAIRVPGYIYVKE